jgi:hypothetical protein
MGNRTQALVLGFFALAVTSLLAGYRRAGVWGTP